MSINNITPEVMALAEQLQDDCQNAALEISKGKPYLSYQDCVNVWLFTKLAELQLTTKEKKA